MNTQKNAPIARNPFILGEPVVGGTVIGSYLYDHPDQMAEGESIFSWKIDGNEQASTLELLLTQEHAGKSIEFSVTPVGENGDAGDLVLAPEKMVYAGFQNITDEENENSFMKQHGNFSFYTPEPADRIFVSTGGAFSLLDNHTQNTYVNGQKEYAAEVPDAIKSYLRNNPALCLFATEFDFAGLVPLGDSTQLLAWGKNIPANLELGKLRNIESVYANGNAFAFIYKKLNADNQWIGAIGSAASGGTVPQEIHTKLVNDPPQAIYATYAAFAVLTQAGKVYAWGSSTEGGMIDSAAQAYLDRMTVNRMVATLGAFCALDAQGAFVTWGNALKGGTIPAERLERILDQGGVKSVIACREAFCAVTQGRAIAVSWGNGAHGGDMHANAASFAARGNIVMCRAATWAFTMVNASGQIEAWGWATHGGTIPPARRHVLEKHFKNQLAAIYDKAPGDNLDAEAEHFASQLDHVGPRLTIGDGTVSIFGNDTSFFCMVQDENYFTNELLAWGMPTGGGLIPDDIRQSLMASRIRAVFCTNGAYGVISSQGSTEGAVLVWGASLAAGDAGEIPKEPPEIAELLRKGIIELYSIKRSPPTTPVPVHVDPSFAARHINGSYILWGGNVVNQVFNPKDEEPTQR